MVMVRIPSGLPTGQFAQHNFLCRNPKMRGYIWMKQSIHYHFRSMCVILTLMDVLSSLRPWHYVCSTFAFCLSKVIQNLTLASVWSRKHVWNCWTRWRKSKQMQPMWLCIRSCKCSEGPFENTQWRKAKQMQPMRLCLLSGRWFEETFEEAQRRKVKQVQSMWLCIRLCKCFEGSFENAQWRKVK